MNRSSSRAAFVCVLVALCLLPTAASAATTTSVPSNVPWTATGFTIKPLASVLITATGRINYCWGSPEPDDTNQPQCDATPDGSVSGETHCNSDSNVPGGICGALIGRINGGPAFIVGSRKVITSASGGTLELGIQDYGPPWENNSGTFEARIRNIYSLSGSVKLVTCAKTCTRKPLVGTRLTIKGGGESTSVTTRRNGTYAAKLPEGTYTVSTPTPRKPWSPPQAAVALTRNVSGVDFDKCGSKVSGAAATRSRLGRAGGGPGTPCEPFVLGGKIVNIDGEGVTGLNMYIAETASSPVTNLYGTHTLGTGAFVTLVPGGTYLVSHADGESVLTPGSVKIKVRKDVRNLRFKFLPVLFYRTRPDSTGAANVAPSRSVVHLDLFRLFMPKGSTRGKVFRATMVLQGAPPAGCQHSSADTQRREAGLTAGPDELWANVTFELRPLDGASFCPGTYNLVIKRTSDGKVFKTDTFTIA